MASAERVALIVLGTDPAKKNGGIAFAIPGHLAAYRALGIKPVFIATHSSAGALGKWLPWLRAMPELLGQLIAERRAARVPIVICHVGGGALSMLRKLVLACLARLFGGQVVMHLHGLEVDDYLASGLGRRVFAALLAPAGAVAVLTPWWQSRLRATGVAKPVYVIPNPLPGTWEQQAARLRACHESQGHINILTVARLERGKGVDDLVEAMALLPEDYRLAIAGTGAQQAELQGRVAALGLQQRVRFYGWVAGAEKQALFDQADIFCLPSRYDSFGMGYLEAMANGLPVVAYDWGPVTDVVADQRCGYLAKEHTPAALAESIKQMASVDCRRAQGEAAKAWVLEQFAAARVAQDVKRLLESLCQ
jgi:glycosyltransferase involved in cell wall biosynthesis